VSPIHGIDPSRVEAAVFDLGGVFIAGGVEAVRSFGERHGVTVDAWDVIRRELFDHDGLWSAVERGERPFDEFVTHLIACVQREGGTVPLESARDFMRSAGESARELVRPEIVDAARRIHERMPTALLTNNIREWRDGWRSLIPVDELFDVIVDSCEIGARKPEPKIYEVTQERLGVAHESIFFVDDLGVNLKAARTFGWQTLRYDDTARVLEVLDALAAVPARRP
jgi:putative hydrolase of the HAD superfamily